MSKWKILIPLLTALAVPVATSSPAAAHEFLSEGLHVLHWFDLHEELGTTNRLTGTPFGVSTKIQCEHRWYHLEILDLTTLHEGEESGCTVEKPANCTVNEPILLKVTGTLEESGSALVFKYVPESGTTFTEITLEGASCSLKGKPFKVEGSQTCELPEIGVELVTHIEACKTSGSALTAGGKAATFESSGAEITMEGGWYELESEAFGSGQKWSAV